MRTALIIALALLGVQPSVAATPSATMCTFHALGLRSDGRVLGWGADHEGELGRGRLLLRHTPGPIVGSAGARSVAAGSAFGLALLASGEVVAWGDNGWGQLGAGDFLFHGNELTRPLDGVKAIAATRNSAVALRNDGSVWTWGGWPLGRGEPPQSSPVPGRVEGLENIVAIAAGGGHVLALRSDGTVLGFGDVSALGDYTQTNALPADLFAFPKPIANLSGVAAIAAGPGYSLALTTDGTVLTWDGRQPVPRPVEGAQGAVAISAGSGHALALMTDGTVRAWGGNRSGEQGLGTADSATYAAHAVPGLEGVVAVSAGSSFSLALKADGEVWSWGLNRRGQLGLDPREGNVRATAARVALIEKATAIAAGEEFSVAVTFDHAFAWGDNVYQQLAAGPILDLFQTTPIEIAELDRVSAVACGTQFSLALREDGSVWAWGANRSGQLGDGSTAGRSRPAPVEGLPPIAAIDASSNHAVALDREGGVWVWGGNIFGWLATGDMRDVLRPRRLALPERIVALSTASHTLALAASGRVLAWGYNRDGQVGDGTTIDRLQPAYVEGIPAASAVAAGDEFSLALATDGRVWAWGSPRHGTRGIGLEPSFEVGLEPTRVAVLEAVAAIAAGSDHALALLADGSLWGWGGSYQGQLGTGIDPTDFAKWAPVPLLHGLSIGEVSAGRWNSFARTRDGAIFGTGWNTEGQLGDGSLVDRSTWRLTSGIGGAPVLDLSPENPVQIPDSRKVPFGVATSSKGGAQLFVRTDIVVDPGDVGREASVFVFAIAPVTQVKNAPRPKEGEHVACVLAQIGAGGQLEMVSASRLQSYVSGVLGDQVRAVDVINGAQASDLAGATFFVGYGPDGTQMINGGANRSVMRVEGQPECRPQSPQTGWWWNAAEPGRGYSIEASGNRIFFAAFMYEPSGASTWYVANGATSVDGSLFTGPLFSASGGQTLGGPYRPPEPLRGNGPLTLAFNGGNRGTIVWPNGGILAIERFEIVPGGLASVARPGQPEAGWWWNPDEPGRGFFLEWQNGSVDMAGYMYDENGKPVWYLAVYPTPDVRAVDGSWWSYADGQAMTGPHKPARRVNDNVAPVTVRFTGVDTALMTLPGGRTTQLRRHRF